MARKNPPKFPNGHKTARSTIALKATTKSRMDQRRAPGQCYDGFLCQLIDMWDRVHGANNKSSSGPAGGNQGAGAFFGLRLK